MNFKNERGLTLIEVLLSITILGIVATSFLSFFNQAYSYTKMNEDKTVGINVARNVLYYVEQQDFDKIKNTYLTGDEKDITIDNCNDIYAKKPNETVFDDPEVCKGFFATKINNVDFDATVTFTKDLMDDDDPNPKPNLQSQLIGVEVIVKWPHKKETSVKGLIEND